MLIDMQTLKDKNILVIGATGGIGSRAAKLLAGSGAKLFLTGRNKYSLQEVASACNEIRITNLYLGGVDSPFWDNIDLKVQHEKLVQVEEAAKALWFLCQQPNSGVVSEMVLQPFNHQVI